MAAYTRKSGVSNVYSLRDHEIALKGKWSFQWFRRAVLYLIHKTDYHAGPRRSVRTACVQNTTDVHVVNKQVAAELPVGRSVPLLRHCVTNHYSLRARDKPTSP